MKAEAATGAPPARSAFGHPKGLYYLALTEAWERFSYYGMTALVVLYMINQLLLPGHVENIAGFPAFRSALESVFGPMGVAFLTLFVASAVMGWLGRFYEPLGPLQFWALHAAIGAVGGVAVLLFGGALSRALKAPA